MKKNQTIKDTKIINDVLKTLIYFHNFNYPLSLKQLHNYSLFSKSEINKTLEELTRKQIIFKLKKYYSLNPNINTIENRFDKEKRAKKMMKLAIKMSCFIQLFPYVRAVFLSGSISKKQFKKTDDIDYFIITSPNRLWIARTFLVVFKKVFLLNSKKYFCINYFKSSDSLAIDEHNRFTATEFATLIPVYGFKLYTTMKDINSWVKIYFPYYKTEIIKEKEINNGFLKKLIEHLLKGKFGDFLENKFRIITHNHQRKKFNTFNKSTFNLAFKSTKTTSKHHPENYQEKVVNLMNSQIKLLNHKHDLKIPLE